MFVSNYLRISIGSNFPVAAQPRIFFAKLAEFRSHTPPVSKALEMGEAVLRNGRRLAIRLDRPAQYCALLGKEEKVREYLGQALEIDPGNAENLLKAAIIEGQAGDDSRALAYLDDALVKGLNWEKAGGNPHHSTRLEKDSASSSTRIRWSRENTGGGW